MILKTLTTSYPNPVAGVWPPPYTHVYRLLSANTSLELAGTGHISTFDLLICHVDSRVATTRINTGETDLRSMRQKRVSARRRKESAS